MNKLLIRILLFSVVVVNNSCNSKNSEELNKPVQLKEDSTIEMSRQAKSLKYSVLDNQNNELKIELISHFNLPVNVALSEKNQDDILSASREIIKEYNYREIYDTKRREIEVHIEETLKKHFINTDLEFLFVELQDVNLPEELLKIENELNDSINN
jgi:hypothetical protein